MANFLRMTAKHLRPTLTCLGAFAAGCLLVSDVFGQDAPQKTVPVTNMERLFTDKDVWTMPAASPAPQVMDVRPTALTSQPKVQPKRILPGPTASDFMGGIHQASNAARGVKAHVVMSPEAEVATSSWEAPALPQVPSQTRVQAPAQTQQPLQQVQPSNRQLAKPAAKPAFKMPETRVSHAGFQDPSSFNGLGNYSPVEHIASLPTPVVKRYTGVHHLKNVGLQDFEMKVVQTWGKRLSASATKDGRYVTVEMPTRVPERMVMSIDRKTQTLNFEGDESLKDNWHRLVQSLDSMPRMQSNGRVIQATVVEQGRAETRTIKQVAYMMGLLQDQDGTAELQLPAGTNIQDLTQIPQDKLQGKVKLVEDPDTGALTIVASPEDIELLKKVIKEISDQATANQPGVKKIFLNNVQADLVFEQVQTAYDAGFAASNGPAQLIPIQTPNAIVVLAQPDGIAAVEKIIAEMDISDDMASEKMEGFKAIRLKYIGAVDARDRLQTYFSQANLPAGNGLPSEAVNVIADFRSNTIIVKGSERNIQQAEAFLKTIDVAETGAANVVRIFPLKNTLAEEMAIVLQDAINGQQPNSGYGYNPNQEAQAQGNQNTQTQVSPDQSQLRGAGLTLKTITDGGEEVVGAIMFDVRVTADRNSNSLVITGPEQSMALVQELIKQLDRLPDAETQIKVFEIVNGDAQALLDMLEALFGTDQNAGFNNGTTSALSQLPLQGQAGDGQTLVNLRFSIDPRTNTIIASGPSGDLQVVEDLLNRLDVADVNRSTTSVYRLSNAPALDISEALTTWLDTRSDIIETDPRTNNDQGIARRAINVVPEIVSNSLIVTARPEHRAEIEGIIKALDRRPPMVHVKVLIAEVDLTTLEEFGVELGVQDSLLFDRGTILDAAQSSITGGIGFPFNTSASANANNTFQGDLASQALSNLGVGRINNDLGYGGLVLSAGSDSANILIRALKDRQCVRVLSKPQIMTMENLQGRVSIGAEVPRVAGTTQSNFGVTQDIQFVDVGVILEVTPRVSPDGLIVMAVNAKRSSVGGDESAITIGFGNDGSPIRAPQIIETEANTTLMARSGQTVVFSGLIQENKSHGERGAPILSDLPLIGPLFKFETDQATRSELVIIMTPTLVTDEQDIAMVNQDATERMHWCECDVQEIYGSSVQSRHSSTGDALETYHPVGDPMGGMPVQVESDYGVPLSQRERDMNQQREGIRKASYSTDSKSQSRR